MPEDPPAIAAINVPRTEVDELIIRLALRVTVAENAVASVNDLNRRLAEQLREATAPDDAP